MRIRVSPPTPRQGGLLALAAMLFVWTAICMAPVLDSTVDWANARQAAALAKYQQQQQEVIPGIDVTTQALVDAFRKEAIDQLKVSSHRDYHREEVIWWATYEGGVPGEVFADFINASPLPPAPKK